MQDTQSSVSKLSFILTLAINKKVNKAKISFLEI